MTKNIIRLVYITLCIVSPVFASPVAIDSNKTEINVIHSVGADNDYYAQLLKLALSYSETYTYKISALNKNIPKARRLILLNTTDELHVEMGTATRERESTYLAIPFPLLKGLNGWRIPIINKKTPNKFKGINTLSEFKSLVPVQFHSWSDTKILTSNGISVAKGSYFEGLYVMVHTQRVDYFPRSVVEIDGNLNENKQLNLIKDTHALIHYPTAFYFYVGKNNSLLATEIKTGLELALKDGTFDALFLRFYGKYINEIQHSKRKIFRLNNPFLPEVIPLEREELWIKPLS